MPKTRTIEVVYEDGVFKPLEKVELEEGVKMEIEIKKEKKILDKHEKTREILGKLNTFKPISLKPEKLEEIYIESRRYWFISFYRSHSVFEERTS
ncbi:MAG: antitoxin family protein [Methanophagales archaeon]|nr:antitoxin family protein [Methanophagales archaeon]